MQRQEINQNIIKIIITILIIITKNQSKLWI